MSWYWARVMVFKANSNHISVNRGCQFYLWKKPKYPEKTTNLSQTTDRLYDVKLYRVNLVMMSWYK